MKRFKFNAHFFFVLLTVSALSALVCAGEKFSLSKDRKSAKAVVGPVKYFTVDFEPSLASKVDDYTSQGSTFYLTVGDSCKMRIFATKRLADDGQTYQVNLQIRDPSSISRTVDNPGYFLVSTSGVKFLAVDEVCKDGINFEAHPTKKGMYLVQFILDGNFPDSLGLKADGATLYVEPGIANVPVWGWVIFGICILLLVAEIIAAIIASIIFYVKSRKHKKALPVEQVKLASKTALNVAIGKSKERPSKSVDKSQEQPVLSDDANDKAKKAKLSKEMQPKLSKEGKSEDQAKLSKELLPAIAEDQPKPTKEVLPVKSEDQAKPSKDVPPSKSVDPAPEKELLTYDMVEGAEEDEAKFFNTDTSIPQFLRDRELKRKGEAARMPSFRRAPKSTPNGTIEVTTNDVTIEDGKVKRDWQARKQDDELKVMYKRHKIRKPAKPTADGTISVNTIDVPEEEKVHYF